MERSPLKYPFARAITCVIPSSIVGDTVVAKKKDGQINRTLGRFESVGRSGWGRSAVAIFNTM